MADIFISYKREDRARITPLAQGLEARGYTVWWDLELIAGQKWGKKIKAELDAAKCVIVVWTTQSVAADRTYVSEWVENEADEALKRDVLLPVLLDEGRVAWTHQKVQYATLVGWTGDANAPGFTGILRGVTEHAGARARPEEVELAAWTAAERTGTAQAFRDFSSAHPVSRFSDIARGRAAELDETAAWQALGAAPTILALAGFLRRFPAGRFADEAEARIRAMELTDMRAARPPIPQPALSPGQGPAPSDAAAAWAVIEASLDPADYQHFIEAFRTDSLAFHSVRGAVARVKMLAEWAGLDQNSKEKIQAFAAKVGDFPALAAAVSGALKAWANIRLLHVLKGHGNLVNSAAFSPDGSHIVTGSNDKTARIWDAKTGALRAMLTGHGNVVNSAAFSPDGSHIVTGSGDKTARIWDAETGALRATLKGHWGSVNSAAFSPDGSHIVTASGDKTARIWDAETGALRATLTGHEHWVNSAAFSPDGSQIVTGSADNTARIWDAETGALRATLKGHGGYVRSAAFSPDGSQIVTGSTDNTARIWDAKTGALRATLNGHGGYVLSAAFSPDGSQIVTGSGDHTARIWDAKTGALRATLTGHGGWVRSAAFSPDGSQIVTASGDHTARLWALE